MKRLLIIAATLMTAFNAAAQMMPDSTVQICAYWSVGDRYDYYMEHSSKKVNSQGDTVKNELNSKILRFEVIDSTATSYQMKLTYLDEKSTNQQSNMLYQLGQEKGINVPVLFTTTEMGVLVSIDNLDEIVSGYEKLIDPMIEIIVAQLPEEDKKMFDWKAMSDQLKPMICNPQAIQTAIIDEIGRLFFFHGSRLEMDHTYNMEEPLMFMMPGIENITAKTNVWLEGELTDEYSTVGRTYTCANMGEEFVKSAVQTTVDLTMNSLVAEDSLKTQAQNEIDSILQNEELQKYQLVWEQYSTEEVHLGTGWPLNLYIDKYVKAGLDGKMEETIDSRSIEIILEE